MERLLSLFGIVMTLCAGSLYSYEIENFGSVSTVSGAVEVGSILWVATDGGIFMYDMETEKSKSLRNATDFPDVEISAITKDNSGFVWAASRSGYIYKIDKNGYATRSAAYRGAGWVINDLLFYDSLLIVSSSSGVSLFNTEKMSVMQSAVAIGDFTSPYVNTATIINGKLASTGGKTIYRLYLGLNEGVAWTDISDGLQKKNFFDATIWETEKTSFNVNSVVKSADSLITSRSETAIFKGTLCEEVDSSIYVDGESKGYCASDITFIKPGKDKCWFGTSNNYLFSWDGTTRRQVVFNGLAFNYVNKTFMSSKGVLWVIPNTGGEKKNPARNIAVMSYEKGAWAFYDRNQGNFGKLGDGGDFLGVAEDNNGMVWLGNHGGALRKIAYGERWWYRYQTPSPSITEFALLPQSTPSRWSKVDALLRDKNGFMWAGLYGAAGSGALLCFNPDIHDPGIDDYRSFFPLQTSWFMNNVTALSQDSAGNILVGAADGPAMFSAFKYTGSPLVDGVADPYYSHSTTNEAVFEISSSDDSTSFVATSKALYLFATDINGMGGLYQVPFSAEGGLIKSICPQTIYRSGPSKDTVTNVFWFGVNGASEGVGRGAISYTRNSSGLIQNITTVFDSSLFINESNGLMPGVVSHVNLDKKEGVLWASTKRGISRIDLGHTFIKREDNNAVTFYPNPVSLSRHRSVTFTKVKPNSRIMIYTIDGRLIDSVYDRGNGGVVKTGIDWSYVWKPSSALIPGPYIYSVVDPDGRKTSNYGKMLLLP